MSDWRINENVIETLRAEVERLKAEAKDRQKALEVAIEERTSALAERNWANERWEEGRAEVERLREALRSLEGLFSYSDTAQCFSVPANARTMTALRRAREALGAVES